MATRPSFFSGQFLDTTGGVAIVAAGYLLDTFDSGTTTPKVTYANEAQTTANANPVVLDAAGRCSLFLAAGQYTLRLRTPGGSVVYTWDDVEGLPTASAVASVPVAGGVSMTGLFSLSGNATAALNPVPKQQLDSAIAAEAAARVAGDAAVLPVQTGNAGKFLTTSGTVASWATLPATMYRLASADGSSKTRNVTLAAGTYEITFQSTIRVRDEDIGSGSFTITSTHAGIVGSTTVNLSITIEHGGSRGYGRQIYATRVGVGSLVVAAQAVFAMTINAVALSGAQECTGAILHVEKTA